MSKEYTSLGLMSGTSADGVDASIIKSDVLYRRGGSYERMGNYEKADEDLLHALRIDPSDAKDGYIVLDLYESSDANAPLIENLTAYSAVADNGTLRHGVTSGDLMTQNHPVTNGFSISTVAG